MTNNPFRALHDLGYTRLVSVIPPIDSTKHIRHAGKRPGLKGENGFYGVGTHTFGETTDAQIEQWFSDGASAGIHCDVDVVGFDLDVTSEEWAPRLKAMALDVLGPGAERIGRPPKLLLMYRTAEPMEYRQHRFDDGTEKGGLVELIAGPHKMFVAHGKHPAGFKYRWPNNIPPKADLPLVTPEQVDEFFHQMATLPRARGSSASPAIDRSTVDQSGLEAPADKRQALIDAMRMVPNRHADFGYEKWVCIAAATRGAFPDVEDAVEVFVEFSERTDLTELNEDPERVVRSLNPPFAFGYPYLASIVSQYAPKALPLLHHEPVPEAKVELNPFKESEEKEAAETAAADVYPLLTLDEIMSRPPPVYMIARHIPQVSMGFLYSVPGAGKTFLALDMALSAAAALESWHGDAITADPDAIVLYIVSEGSFGFRNRVKAWLKARGIENAPKRFLIIEKTINFMNAEDVDRLLRTVRATGRKLCMVVVDTVSRAMPGADENLQKEMTLFVNACDRVKDAFGCAVLGVHHAGKSGDMRGSTVLLGAGDYVFKLEREQGRTIGRLRCEKQKDAPDGWEEPYSFAAVDLGEGESSLVVDRVEDGFGPATELTPAVGAAVLRAMGEAWDSGEPWSKAPQSKERHYVRRMVSDFGFKAGEAEEMIRVWEGSGLIVTETRDAKRRKAGFKVVGAMPKLDELTGVFD